MEQQEGIMTKNMLVLPHEHIDWRLSEPERRGVYWRFKSQQITVAWHNSITIEGEDIGVQGMQLLKYRAVRYTQAGVWIVPDYVHEVLLATNELNDAQLLPEKAKIRKLCGKYLQCVRKSAGSSGATHGPQRRFARLSKADAWDDYMDRTKVHIRYLKARLARVTEEYGFAKKHTISLL